MTFGSYTPIYLSFLPERREKRHEHSAANPVSLVSDGQSTGEEEEN